jgi:hypothetical protein
MTLQHFLATIDEEFDEKFLQTEVEERAVTFLNQPNIIQETTELKQFLHSAILRALEEARERTRVEKQYTAGGTKERAIIFNSALAETEKKWESFMNNQK